MLCYYLLVQLSTLYYLLDIYKHVRTVYLNILYMNCKQQYLYIVKMSKQVSDAQDEKNTNSVSSWLKRYRGMSDTFVF